jgi:hypothetical protein
VHVCYVEPLSWYLMQVLFRGSFWSISLPDTALLVGSPEKPQSASWGDQVAHHASHCNQTAVLFCLLVELQ